MIPNYFDRRPEESIRYCPQCRMTTKHDRYNGSLWTCRDSGHRHPTRDEQEGLIPIDPCPGLPGHRAQFEIWNQVKGKLT